MSSTPSSTYSSDFPTSGQAINRLIAEHSNRLAALLTIQQDIAGHLDPLDLLQRIADEARRLTASKNSLVFLPKDEFLELAVISGPEENISPIGHRLPIQASLSGEAFRSQKIVYAQDVPTDPRAVHDVGVNSYLVAPLIFEHQSIGVLGVTDKVGTNYTPEDESVLALLATNAAIGLENARLYQQEHAARREAERRIVIFSALRDILAVLNSNQPIEQVLDFIAAQARDLLNADATMVCRADIANNITTTVASNNLPREFDKIRVTPFYYSENDLRLIKREPVVIPDIAEAMAPFLSAKNALDDLQHTGIEAETKYFKSQLKVPLFVQGSIYGWMTIYYQNAHEFSEEDIRLSMTLADQLSLAIENTHLRTTQEQAAVAAERNRLARDLHDAVTQTLFSATLIADVLPRIWERNPEEGKRRLEEVRQLTRGALAEMRTLLLELRPSALADASLPDLLHHLTDAFIGRSRIQTDLHINGTIDLPPDVKLAVYRIAQEALNNIGKHSMASQVNIAIEKTGQRMLLEISDNGRGFNPTVNVTNHLGLGIMRERAESIDASLIIDSGPGKGTHIFLHWQPRTG
ncbi:GAF domain-containing sensor histidine kinase [Longilinea arvoryzae]|uniref:GAF domain-containing sensor histidine kinase n=1 Tax=Longilinea arvoryzae TaxID=360412 RepID=UPI00155FE11D|nr:GAF domain-containing protein [Longilinea arvoryzae]